MPATRRDALRLLRPYLIGEEPREDGEWDMHCPLHEDNTRSAQLNAELGVWFCHKECGGGKVAELIRRRAEWVPPPTANSNGHSKTKRKGKRKKEKINEARILAWAKALQNQENEKQLNDLMGERGLTPETIDKYEIGWDRNSHAYTLPIRSEDGSIWNVRRYQLNPSFGRRKIWSVDGMGSPRIYPLDIMNGQKSIIICEGELDALLTIQNGYAAVTRTASAVTWRSEWSGLFQDRIVYLAHDCDAAGQQANKKVAQALERIAKDVRVIDLGYKITPKHGKDLTDWWHEHPAQEFEMLLETATSVIERPEQEIEELDPADASVLDSFDSRRVGKPLRMTVTIKGKREPGYSIPKRAHLACTRDAGPRCNICPLNGINGEADVDIPPTDEVVLQLIESTKSQVGDVIRQHYGAVKCNRLIIDVQEFQSVEILYARPSVDHHSNNDPDGGEYKNVKLTSVGRHDTQPNNTVQVTGALFPDPRRQHNEFVAWDVDRLETSLDKFTASKTQRKLMERFQPAPKQSPLAKLRQISDDLAKHVTRIYGRPEMHMLIDLTFHSAIAFDFAGKRIGRGWIESLIVGDTRTGKSEAAQMMSRHYNAGEIVSCESASFAGIIGGMQQYGSNKEWSITWGAVPINDRRLVVLDEIGGLTTEEIAAMSSVRSSGLAQLTKIQSEATHARTRLLWIGNPRNSPMSDFTYGVQAIAPLIGNPEDIARFDLAMSVRAGEVPADEINRVHSDGRQRYGADACRANIRWVWSRTPAQIRWMPGAEEAVFKAAQKLGAQFIEDPPLIQVANVREKIARVAVALAGRLHSSDKAGERLLVRRTHVRAAVEFIETLYSMPGFGYAERSREVLNDAKKAAKLKTEIKAYLYEKPNLAKFLRNTSKFRRQDIEEVLNVDREQANAIISHLWESKMIRKDKGDCRVQPALHELLRELKIE